MSIRLQIAAMLFLMIQAVLFFTVTVALLISPWSNEAMALMPWVVGITAAISAPLSWWLAPHLRARTWREKGTMDILR